VRPLGQAGSPLEWFACPSCHHVWAAGLTIPAPPVATASAQLTGDRRKHIVVVDDDTLTLSLVERTLSDYRVSTARDGSEALVILLSTEPVHLLLTDYLMPVMTGEELVNRARERRPGLPVLIMTGHSHAVAAADPVWWAAERHVTKPFRLDALREAVAALIG
jgi:two-component system cell cycle sensor histidine kinase/response regulator CckA